MDFYLGTITDVSKEYYMGHLGSIIKYLWNELTNIFNDTFDISKYSKWIIIAIVVYIVIKKI